MQRGFLKTRPEKPRLHNEDSAEVLAAPASAAAVQGAQQAEFEARWRTCLELLRGSNDEKKFAGLLLVTKLLPAAGSAAAVQQVHDAVGDAFISRLLLPLHTSRSTSLPAAAAPDAAALEKQAGTAMLGLAVLSSFVRLPELAAAEEQVQKLPLFLNVIRAGGIKPLLARRQQQASPPTTPTQADSQMDAAALQDALECAVAVAGSSFEGRDVAEQSGAVMAAVNVLQSPAAQARPELVLLALRLLAAVLSGPRRQEVILSSPSDVLQLLPALAAVFALPAGHAHMQQQQQQQQDPASQQQQREQLAAVQLEALHALLLLLPLPLPAGEHLQKALQSAARRGAWPHLIRAGLAVLLRGRISAVQRHSALQLAAAMVDLVGPQWPLGGPFSAGSAAAQKQADVSADAFFQLLVEVTRIETSVLLLDALGPGAPVPRSAEPAASAQEWRPPQPRSAPSAAGSSGDEEDDSMDVDAGPLRSGTGLSCTQAMATEGAAGAAGSAGAGQGAPPSDMERLYKVLQSEDDRRTLEDQMQREHAQATERAREDHVQRVDSTRIPTDMRWEGPSESAGERAARVLPACFELLEACIECLAEDSHRAEAALSMDAPLSPSATASAGSAELERAGSHVPLQAFGSGALSCDASTSSAVMPVLPVLSEAVAQRALRSLEEAVEAVLQFLEQQSAAQQQQQQQQAAQQQGKAAAVPQPEPPQANAPLLLASARVLGRFCAEVPVAFDSRVQQLLPFLLSLSAPQPPGQAEPGPDCNTIAACMPQESMLPPAAEGVVFMLPMLLQVTQAGAGEAGGEAAQQAWLATLAHPAVLHHLVLFACTTALCCSKTVTTTAAQAADDSLVYACQLLLAILRSKAAYALQPGAQQPPPQQQPGQLSPLVQQVFPLLITLLLLVPHRPVVPPQEATPLQHVRHVRLLSTIAALAAVVLAAAAVELRVAGRAAPTVLGGVSTHSLQQVCALILSGLQSTVQLLQSKPQSSRQSVAHRLQEAAAAAAEDEAVRQELRVNLGTLASAATSLLCCYPPFSLAASQHAWLSSMLAAGAADSQAALGLAEGAPAQAGGLQQLLRAVRAFKQQLQAPAASSAPT